MKRSRRLSAVAVVRWLVWAAWAAFMWVAAEGDVLRYWPALLAGALIGVFPVVVIYVWTAYRGDRLGRL